MAKNQGKIEDWIESVLHHEFYPQRYQDSKEFRQGYYDGASIFKTAIGRKNLLPLIFRGFAVANLDRDFRYRKGFQKFFQDAATELEDGNT